MRDSHKVYYGIYLCSIRSNAWRKILFKRISSGPVSCWLLGAAARHFPPQLKADIAAGHARCNKRTSHVVLRLFAAHNNKKCFKGEIDELFTSRAVEGDRRLGSPGKYIGPNGGVGLGG